jgi:hypothetical protein
MLETLWFIIHGAKRPPIPVFDFIVHNGGDGKGGAEMSKQINAT